MSAILKVNIQRSRTVKILAVLMVLFLFVSILLPSAGAAGLVDNEVNEAYEYSKYPIENYQLDFYVDTGWDWLPWNWTDGIGKSVNYALYSLTNLIWIFNINISSAVGSFVEQGFTLDLITQFSSKLGENIQKIAGVSPDGITFGFYSGLLLLLILIVGIYVLYVGMIKREVSKAISAVLNMALIFVLSAGMIAYAPSMVQNLNEFSKDMSSAALNVGMGFFNPEEQADGVKGVRDLLFDIQVKQPWLILQFGDSSEESIGEERVQSVLEISPDVEKGKTREDAVKKEIEDNGNTNMTVTKSVQRFGTTLFVLLFNIVISAFVLLLMGAMVLSQILFVVYAMVLPISALLSMLPTFHGVGKKAVLTLFNAIMARTGIVLLTTIAFSLCSMVYSFTSEMSFFWVAILQILVFAAIIYGRNKLLGMVSLSDDGGASAMGRMLLRRPRMAMRRGFNRAGREIGREMRKANMNTNQSGKGASRGTVADSKKTASSKRSATAKGKYTFGEDISVKHDTSESVKDAIYQQSDSMEHTKQNLHSRMSSVRDDAHSSHVYAAENTHLTQAQRREMAMSQSAVHKSVLHGGVVADTHEQKAANRVVTEKQAQAKPETQAKHTTASVKEQRPERADKPQATVAHIAPKTYQTAVDAREQKTSRMAAEKQAQAKLETQAKHTTANVKEQRPERADKPQVMSRTVPKTYQTAVDTREQKANRVTVEKQAQIKPQTQASRTGASVKEERQTGIVHQRSQIAQKSKRSEKKWTEKEYKPKKTQQEKVKLRSDNSKMKKQGDIRDAK